MKGKWTTEGKKWENTRKKETEEGSEEIKEINRTPKYVCNPKGKGSKTLMNICFSEVISSYSRIQLLLYRFEHKCLCMYLSVVYLTAFEYLNLLKSNGRVLSKRLIGEVVERSDGERWEARLPRHVPGVTEISHYNLSQNSHYLGWYSWYSGIQQRNINAWVNLLGPLSSARYWNCSNKPWQKHCSNKHVLENRERNDIGISVSAKKY